MRDVGADDRMPYVKADIVLACHLGDSFALSFYQIDYQSVITQKQAIDRSGVESAALPSVPMAVAKVVLDREGFARLYSEVAALAAKTGVVK